MDHRKSQPHRNVTHAIAIGSVVIAAIAGSANAGIVTGPGIGIDCLTMEIGRAHV